MLVGLLLAFMFAVFLLLGRKAPTASSSRSARSPAPMRPSGWSPAGSMSAPATASPPSSCCRWAPTSSSRASASIRWRCAVLRRWSMPARALLVRSQLGLVLAGMRQNEERLAFFGYRVQLFKALVFSLRRHDRGPVAARSTATTRASSARATWVRACRHGGDLLPVRRLGTLIGPVLGTAAIEVLSYVLADIDAIKQFWPVILGLVLLVVVMFQPSGMLGFVVSRARAHRLLWLTPRRRMAGRAEPMALLEVRGVTKIFGTLRALDGVDLTVAGRHLPRADRAERLGQEHAAEGDRRRALRRRPAPSASTGYDITAAPPYRARARRAEPEVPDHRGAARTFGLRQRAAGAAIATKACASLLRSRSRRALDGEVMTALERFRLRTAPTTWRASSAMASSNGSRSPWRWRSRPKLLLLDEPTGGMSPEERRVTGELLAPIRSRLHAGHRRARPRFHQGHLRPADGARPGPGAGRRHVEARSSARPRSRRSIPPVSDASLLDVAEPLRRLWPQPGPVRRVADGARARRGRHPGPQRRRQDARC